MRQNTLTSPVPQILKRIKAGLKELRPSKLLGLQKPVKFDPTVEEYIQKLSQECDVLALKMDLRALEEKIDRALALTQTQPSIN
jgi:hypothetical protein